MPVSSVRLARRHAHLPVATLTWQPLFRSPGSTLPLPFPVAEKRFLEIFLAFRLRLLYARPVNKIRPKFNNMSIHITLKSANVKTGPIPVSTSSATTCPDACPFKLQGCYAKSGPLAIHWSKVTSGLRGIEWNAFLETVRSFSTGQLWRHNQAGDLPGTGDKIDVKALGALAKANTGRRGFTYTHKPATGSNLRAIRSANRAGFVVNLSANSIQHADKLAKLKLPVAAVVPQNSPDRFTTPGGNKVVICPAQRVAGLSCDKCRLCAKADRGFIIGFRPHGTGAKKVEAITNA